MNRVTEQKLGPRLQRVSALTPLTPVIPKGSKSQKRMDINGPKIPSGEWRSMEDEATVSVSEKRGGQELSLGYRPDLSPDFLSPTAAQSCLPSCLSAPRLPHPGGSHIARSHQGRALSDEKGRQTERLSPTMSLRPWDVREGTQYIIWLETWDALK